MSGIALKGEVAVDNRICQVSGAPKRQSSMSVIPGSVVYHRGDAPGRWRFYQKYSLEEDKSMIDRQETMPVNLFKCA